MEIRDGRKEQGGYKGDGKGGVKGKGLGTVSRAPYSLNPALAAQTSESMHYSTNICSIRVLT